MSENTWLDKKDWFDELVQKAKEIESRMTLDIWRRYAECGKLLIETGYKHSLEARGFLKSFMDAMGIKSRGTITTMVQLGRMKDEEIADAIVKYRVIYNFAHKLPITEDVAQYKKERQKPARECECTQGNPGFPHCCVLCPSYAKKAVK